ncbi:MAG: protease SohB [Pseudomonadota bacterium]|nr:protease SohB [Pseudomonadota bacterium]
MNDILINYAVFLLKTITIIVAIFLILGKIFSLKQEDKSTGKIKLKKLNEEYTQTKNELSKDILSKVDYKKLLKSEKKQQKKLKKSLPKLFLLEFKGDIRASAAAELRDEITAILSLASTKDKVVIQLESPGGCVHDYGFAASQLSRIREKNITLVVAVDKVAASGGYMMASVASEIIAAPFAVIGSIGVYMALPNFHKFLKDKKIEFEDLTAGPDKRNLTTFSPNTKDDREKAQEQIDNIHRLFIDFVKKYRPNIDPEKVATGKTWHALDAINLNLIDKIITSDDYITSAMSKYEVLRINKKKSKKILEKLTQNTLAYFGIY